MRAIGTYRRCGPLQNGRRSDDRYRDSVGVCRESFDVIAITSDHCSARLGESDDESIHSRTGSGPSPQLGCSPCGRLTHRRVDDAHLQESVGVGVASRIAIQGFDENHRRDDWRPQFLCLERPNERQGGLGTGREARQSAAVKNQHRSTDSVE